MSQYSLETLISFLQEDLAAAHRAKTTRNWFADCGVLLTVENLWGLGQLISSMPHRIDALILQKEHRPSTECIN